MPFISFCCLIGEARTSSTMLNSSGENGNLSRVPELRGKAPSVSPLRMIFAVDAPFFKTDFETLKNLACIS